MIVTQTFLENIHLKSSQAATSRVFRGDFRLEVVKDVISGAYVRQVGTDALAKFGDSRSNCSRDIELPHFGTNNANDDHDAGVRRS